MAYLRLAVSLRDDVALARVINTPRRGLGDTSVEKLQWAAAARGLTLSALLFGAAGSAAAAGGAPSLPPLPDRKELGITPKAAAALEGFQGLMLSLHAAVSSQPLGVALNTIIDEVRTCRLALFGFGARLGSRCLRPQLARSRRGSQRSCLPAPHTTLTCQAGLAVTATHPPAHPTRCGRAARPACTCPRPRQLLYCDTGHAHPPPCLPCRPTITSMCWMAAVAAAARRGMRWSA